MAMLDHLWENRVMGRNLLAEDHRWQLVQGLASMIEARRAGTAQAEAPNGALAAVRIAGGQLALLEHWLSGRAPGAAADVAQVLRARSF